MHPRFAEQNVTTENTGLIVVQISLSDKPKTILEAESTSAKSNTASNLCH